MGQGIISSSLCIGNSEEPKRTGLSPITEPSKCNSSTLQCCCWLNLQDSIPCLCQAEFPLTKASQVSKGCIFHCCGGPLLILADVWRIFLPETRIRPQVLDFPRQPLSEVPSPAPRWAEQGAGCVRVCVEGMAFAGVKAGVQISILLPIQLTCSWQGRLVMPACRSGAAWKMGAHERVPMGWLGLCQKPGASSGAGCPAGFDWLQLLVCTQLGCFWKACLFDLSASFLTLSCFSAASFPPCEHNRGSLKSLCLLGFQVTFHLFNVSLKLNARTSFQEKK